MREIRTMAEAEEVLAGFVPMTRKITGLDITLDRMKPLMELFGNPQQRLKIIHVAGTSGKTSTAYYIATMLQLSGRKVGLTISPHIDSVAERVQINLEPLSEQEFVNALNECMKILNTSDINPTYFELLVCMAYWYFDKTGVDYAVIETGMGGLHDGTNIADNPDKVCVITDIGLDHMRFLGNTVQEIAKQKAGIIYAGNKAFINPQPDEVTNVFAERCKDVGAELTIVSDEVEEDTSSLPDYQQRNWTLAYNVYLHIAHRDNLAELDKDNLHKSMQARVPARMDIVETNGKTIIMDGAHNEQKMQAFVNSFTAKHPSIKVPVLLALKLGKEFTAVLPLIKPITSKLIISEFEAGQDLPIPAIDAEELGAAAKQFGFVDVVVEPDKNKAYELLMKEQGELGIVTGSFYLIGQLRASHKELKDGKND